MIKKNNKKYVTLYNLYFPLWFMLMLPIGWIILFPVDFVIDSLVLLVSLKVLKVDNKKQFYKKHIFKIFCFGLLADAISAGIMFLLILWDFARMGDELYMTLPALVLSSFLIYKFNYKVTFKNADDKLRHKLSLIFAIATAPYTFLFPSSLLYGF